MEMESALNAEFRKVEWPVTEPSKLFIIIYHGLTLGKYNFYLRTFQIFNLGFLWLPHGCLGSKNSRLFCAKVWVLDSPHSHVHGAGSTSIK